MSPETVGMRGCGSRLWSGVFDVSLGDSLMVKSFHGRSLAERSVLTVTTSVALNIAAIATKMPQPKRTTNANFIILGKVVLKSIGIGNRVR